MSDENICQRVMKLEGSYFVIKNSTPVEDKPFHKIFDVSLVAEHPVYQGHFPGEPVCPGVCSLQMVKECAQHIVGSELIIGYIKQYRLLSVMTPLTHQRIVLDIALDFQENSENLSYHVVKNEFKLFKIKAVVRDVVEEKIKFLELSAELLQI